MSDTIVRLNVGGRIFETTESTLRFDGVENFFTGLLSERTPSLKDSSGAYFIDRDPDYFTILLRFLRTRKLDVTGVAGVTGVAVVTGVAGGLQLSSLYDEALFYSLDSIADVILCRITKPELSGTGDFVGPLPNGAYVNTDNTKAIVFTCCGEDDETEKRIILVEDSSPGTEYTKLKVDAFSQAKVARSATTLPSLWDDWNKVDYAGFFYKYIKRGKFMIRQERGYTFLSLVVPGGEQLTQNKMALLTRGGEELLVFTAANEGAFISYKFISFTEST